VGSGAASEVESGGEGWREGGVGGGKEALVLGNDERRGEAQWKRRTGREVAY